MDDSEWKVYLNDLSKEAYRWLWENHPSFRSVLTDCFLGLSANTYNSERALLGTGFGGGACDGCGLSRYDNLTACYLWENLREPIIDPWAIKKTATLLYKYREQLRRAKRDYPSCLFGVQK